MIRIKGMEVRSHAQFTNWHIMYLKSTIKAITEPITPFAKAIGWSDEPENVLGTVPSSILISGSECDRIEFELLNLSIERERLYEAGDISLDYRERCWGCTDANLYLLDLMRKRLRLEHPRSCDNCRYLVKGNPPACNALRSPYADLYLTNDCNDWEEGSA